MKKHKSDSIKIQCAHVFVETGGGKKTIRSSLTELFFPRNCVKLNRNSLKKKRKNRQQADRNHWTVTSCRAPKITIFRIVCRANKPHGLAVQYRRLFANNSEKTNKQTIHESASVAIFPKKYFFLWFHNSELGKNWLAVTWCSRIGPGKINIRGIRGRWWLRPKSYLLHPCPSVLLLLPLFCNTLPTFFFFLFIAGDGYWKIGTRMIQGATSFFFLLFVERDYVNVRFGEWDYWVSVHSKALISTYEGEQLQCEMCFMCLWILLMKKLRSEWSDRLGLQLIAFHSFFFRAYFLSDGEFKEFFSQLGANDMGIFIFKFIYKSESTFVQFFDNDIFNILK